MRSFWKSTLHAFLLLISYFPIQKTCICNHILLPFYCTYFGHIVQSSIERSSTIYSLFLHSSLLISICPFFFLVSSVSTIRVPKMSAVYFCLQLSVSMFFLFSWRLPLCSHVLSWNILMFVGRSITVLYFVCEGNVLGFHSNNEIKSLRHRMTPSVKLYKKNTFKESEQKKRRGIKNTEDNCWDCIYIFEDEIWLRNNKQEVIFPSEKCGRRKC